MIRLPYRYIFKVPKLYVKPNIVKPQNYLPIVSLQNNYKNKPILISKLIFLNNKSWYKYYL